MMMIILNTIPYFRKTLPFLFVMAALSTAFISCHKMPKNMDYIQDEMVRMGYNGKIERPSGTFEKAAMGLMGVEDLMAYNNGMESFAIIKFKNATEEEIDSRIQNIMSFIELYIAGEDYDKLSKTKELIQKQSILHNNIMVVWQYEKPDDVIKLIKKSF